MSDPDYHRIRKRARFKLLRQISELLIRYLNTGALFLNKKVLCEPAQEFLLQFLLDQGIRKINKFWPDVFLQAEQGLASF